jgi:hypothetical protein
MHELRRRFCPWFTIRHPGEQETSEVYASPVHAFATEVSFARANGARMLIDSHRKFLNEVFGCLRHPAVLTKEFDTSRTAGMDKCIAKIFGVLEVEGIVNKNVLVL